MTRTFGIVIAVLLVVAVAAAAGVAFAQSSTPQPAQPGTGYGYGRGMMGGGGMMGRSAQSGTYGPGMMGRGQALEGGYGPMHAELIQAFAAKLDLSVEEINARLNKGETLYQIAQSKGLTAEQFKQVMSDAHNAALAELVKQGTLTQEQADWMKQRGANMPMWGLQDSDGDGELDCPMYDGSATPGGMRGRMGPRFQQQPSGTSG